MDINEYFNKEDSVSFNNSQQEEVINEKRNENISNWNE